MRFPAPIVILSSEYCGSEGLLEPSLWRGGELAAVIMAIAGNEKELLPVLIASFMTFGSDIKTERCHESP